MMKKLYDLYVPTLRRALFAGLFVLTDISAYATDHPNTQLTVVELFTSQGCSSCPPADATLKNLADKPDILALSWPVDYWDRLGWEDTFAQPFNAKRQAAYNKRLGRGGVFTPQMIFNGVEQCVGSDRNKVRDVLTKVGENKRPRIFPSLMIKGDMISAKLPHYQNAGTKTTKQQHAISLRYVWYKSKATVQIGDGENQGRTLHYTNVVLGTEMLDDWDGTSQDIGVAHVNERPEGADHIALILHQGYGHGPIIGAATFALE